MNQNFLKTAKKLARIGPRGVYGQSLLEEARTNGAIFALSADLGNSSGLDRFKAHYPERFLNLGIMEQQAIGFSAGLSTTGYNCFISSFAPFLTMRACEQVRLNLGYMRHNVKLVGIGSGISMGFLGNSHFGLEDISIIRSIPNIRILSAADCFQVAKCVNLLANHCGPAYLRLTGVAPSPIIYEEDIHHKFDDSHTLESGNNLLVITHGAISYEVLQAARSINQNGLKHIHVENAYNIWPLTSTVKHLIGKFNKVLVVEEHRKSGSLYSSILEYASENNINAAIWSQSLPDDFLVSGDYVELKEYYGLSQQSICAKMTTLI